MSETQFIELPFCQGDISACAHISLSIAMFLLNGGTDALSAPFCINQPLMKRALDRGIMYYIEALKKRATNSPSDASKLFTSGVVVRESVMYFNQLGVLPWFESNVSSGFVILRTHVPTSGPIQGHTPRLLDEVERIYTRAQTGIDQAMILTSCKETRAVLMRRDGLWAYDSHGSTHSTLYYFPTVIKLLHYLIRCCRIYDDAAVLENVRQFENPQLRTIDCDFSTACNRLSEEFELVVLEMRR